MRPRIRAESAPLAAALCGVELSSPNVPSSRVCLSADPSAGRAAARTASHSSTYARCSARTRWFASAGRPASSRSWIRMTSGAAVANPMWNAISSSNTAAGVGRAAREDLPAAREQPLARVDEQLGEDGILAREMLVERRPRHADRLTEFGRRHRREPALREECGRLLEQKGAPVRLLRLAPCRRHSPSVAFGERSFTERRIERRQAPCPLAPGGVRSGHGQAARPTGPSDRAGRADGRRREYRGATRSRQSGRGGHAQDPRPRRRAGQSGALTPRG